MTLFDYGKTTVFHILVKFTSIIQQYGFADDGMHVIQTLVENGCY